MPAPASEPLSSVSGTEGGRVPRPAGERDGLAGGRGRVGRDGERRRCRSPPAPFVAVTVLRAGLGCAAPSSVYVVEAYGLEESVPPTVSRAGEVGNATCGDAGLGVGGGGVDGEGAGVRPARK